MTADFPPRLRRILERFSSIDLERPSQNTPAAQDALVRRLAQLGLAPRRVRWADDARSAYAEAYMRALSPETRRPPEALAAKPDPLMRMIERLYAQRNFGWDNEGGSARAAIEGACRSARWVSLQWAVEESTRRLCRRRGRPIITRTGGHHAHSRAWHAVTARAGESAIGVAQSGALLCRDGLLRQPADREALEEISLRLLRAMRETSRANTMPTRPRAISVVSLTKPSRPSIEAPERP